MKIEIPDDILRSLDEHVKKEKRFASVEEYVIYVLKQVIEKLGKTTPTTPAQFSTDEEEKVKKRLRALGYID